MFLRGLICVLACLLAVLLLSPISTSAQTLVVRDAQGLVLLNQSLGVLTGGTSVTDVTLQAAATYIAGSDQEGGAATLEATANQQAHIYLNLVGGQRQEIRNGPAGDWIGTDRVEHPMALHNCWMDATWFFPALTFETALNDSQVSLVYVGQESRGGLAVQHLQISRVLSSQTAEVTALVQKLSSMDVYLDAASSLPVALDFNLHPDNDASTNIPVEIQFANYQPVSGMLVPFHIQKYLQFGLMLDLNVSSVTVNSGIPQTEFTVQ